MAINNIQDADNAWNGITIEELKFRRATTLIHLEMQKEILLDKYRILRPNTESSKSASLISAFNSKLSIWQYVLIGYKGARIIIKGVSMLSKIKNKFKR